MSKDQYVAAGTSGTFTSTHTFPSGYFTVAGNTVYAGSPTQSSETVADKIKRLEDEKVKVAQELETLQSLHPVTIKIVDLLSNNLFAKEPAKVAKIDSLIRTALFSKKVGEVLND